MIYEFLGTCRKICDKSLQSARKHNYVLREEEVNGAWWIGSERTLESLMEQSELYKEKGRKDRKQLPNFYNCEYEVKHISILCVSIIFSNIDCIFIDNPLFLYYSIILI